MRRNPKPAVLDTAGVLVLAAMRRELRPLVRRLELRPAVARREQRAPDAARLPRLGAEPRGAFALWAAAPPRTGDGGRSPVAAATVGVGPAVAAARTTDLLDRLEPVRVLVVGVAGALAPALRVADVVRPEIVVDVATGRRYAPGAAPPRPGARTVGAAREAGALVTVSAVGQRLPPALGAEAVAVDMETAAIAAACEERGVHWRVVRAVSDLPGGLDPRVATLLSADGSVTVRALLRLLGTEPGRLAALLRLGVDTRRAIVAATSAALEELHHGPA